MRRCAHIAFDKLWMGGPYQRTTLYAVLARELELPKERAHIGMFNQEQCAKVIKFSKEMEAIGKGKRAMDVR